MEEPFRCWREAEKADDIVAQLTRIRRGLDPTFVEEVKDVVREIAKSSMLLRDLSDLFKIYRERVELVLTYLMILLPCLRRTLLDIKDIVGDLSHTTRPFQQIWTRILHVMSAEAGVSLRTRFRVYNDFLIELVRLLSRFEATHCDWSPLTSQQTLTMRLGHTHRHYGKNCPLENRT